MAGQKIRLEDYIPELVQRAKDNDWCVTEDHCILRLVYDYACLDDWRNHIKPPAYKNMNEEQYSRAIYMLKRLKIASPHVVELLNFASLKWRGKL